MGEGSLGRSVTKGSLREGGFYPPAAALPHRGRHLSLSRRQDSTAFGGALRVRLRPPSLSS